MVTQINKQYYPSINMLRGIAALMVCVYHFTNFSGPWGDLFPTESTIREVGEQGTLGVFIFFIITGFVIPLSLNKKNFKLNQFHKFISKRWIRIEIPYLVSIIFILLVAFVFSLKNNTVFDLDLTRLFHHLFYTVSFFNYEWYNPIFWTLAIEMQFYILIALLYPLMKINNQILIFMVPIILALSTLIIDDHRLVFHYGAIFSQGILLFLILKLKIDKMLGVIGIIACSIITFYINGIGIAVISLLTVGVIAFFNTDKKLFNWLGKISYSLYLIHGLIGGTFIYFFGRYANDFFTKILIVLAALILSILGSFIYWKLIENPSKKWSGKISINEKT